MGLQLWQEHLGYPRDYLLCLPNKDLNGTIRKRARYADAQCFSRALFGSLTATGGYGRLLSEDALPFWSEHSDRAGVDSWLAAVGVGADHRRFLGRWAATGAQDAYVRTALRICENLQIVAARHARAVAAGGPDYFGEEHLTAQLLAFLRRKGVSERDCEVQTDLLKMADYSLTPTPFASLSPTGGINEEQGEASAGDGVPVPEEADEEEAEDALEMPEAKPEDDQLPPPQGFVVSITRGGRFRRLHFAGGCWRVPGEHYRKYVDYGQRCPRPDEVHARCADCFPPEKLEAIANDSDKESSGSETSSSTSSSSASEKCFVDGFSRML